MLNCKQRKIVEFYTPLLSSVFFISRHLKKNGVSINELRIINLQEGGSVYAGRRTDAGGYLAFFSVAKKN